ASLQLVAKQFEQAESNLDRALEVDATNSEALVLKANLAATGPRKNTEEARRMLKGILDRDSNYVPAIGSLGHLELSEGNANEAEEYFLTALKLQPSNQALQIALADLYARQGR